jgi:hypothetical protein
MEYYRVIRSEEKLEEFINRIINYMDILSKLKKIQKR